MLSSFGGGVENTYLLLLRAECITLTDRASRKVFQRSPARGSLLWGSEVCSTERRCSLLSLLFFQTSTDVYQWNEGKPLEPNEDPLN